MFFEEPTGSAVAQPDRGARMVFGANALALIVLGIAPAWLLQVSENAIKLSLGN
jgi:NADH:ubiquinone oxidoreductase subunit 2 (subunit N)